LQRPKCLVAKCWHFLLVRKVDCRSTEIETGSGHLASTWVWPSCMHCWLISPPLSVLWSLKLGWYKFLRMPSRPNRAEKAHHHCSQAKNHHRGPHPQDTWLPSSAIQRLIPSFKIRFARNLALRRNRGFYLPPKSQGYGSGQAEGVFVVSTCGSPT